MENKESKTRRNIFESAFDSFDLDCAFILNKDDNSREHKIKIKEKNVEEKFSHGTVYKSEILYNENKVDDKMKQFEDLSFFLEDLNESDFFEHAGSKTKKNCPKVINSTADSEAEGRNNKAARCLSPILLSMPKNKSSRSFTSTPLRSNSSSNFEEKKKEKPDENKKAERPGKYSQEISEFGFLEAGLFDDWDAETNSQKDSITLSQAFKLIEEAESARQSNQKQDLNSSIDLLTGRPVGDDVKDLFAESFSLPNIIECKQEREDDCLIISEKSKSGSKLPEILKLNFEIKSEEKKDNFGIDFSSDDDFEFLTQELLKKPKCVKTLSQLRGFSSQESNEIVRKRKKCCRIIESDSADESPDLKFNKRCNKKKISKAQNHKRYVANEFIESEAEVSDVVEVSSDELEEDGEYDASFLDEKLYLTQDSSAKMTAKYLESVKSPKRPDGFKIPPAKAYIPAHVFSQIPEENNSEYELDSFCVNEVEEGIKTDLSELEIAEKILEMDRKKRKRKRIVRESVKIHYNNC